MKLVIIESPYRGGGGNVASTDENVFYACSAMRHSLQRGEAPLAGHLLYPRVLCVESIAAERTLGMKASFAWGEYADLHAFYTDLGWSPGMLEALRRLITRKSTQHDDYEFRSLYGEPTMPYSGDWISYIRALKEPMS